MFPNYLRIAIILLKFVSKDKQLDLLENIKEAYKSIKQNFLRSLLTLLIIAVGITCLVGILTSIDGILFSMSDNFNRLGANTFSFRPKSETIKTSNGGRRRKRGEPITFDQAMEFKDDFKYSGASVSVESWCESNATLKYKDNKTNPNIIVRGVDENYIATSAYELEAGRNFTATETNKVVIGADLVTKLFDGKAQKAINQEISINADKYVVVGTLKSRGSSSGGGEDRRIFIPLITSKFKYGYARKNYNLSVSVLRPDLVDETINSSIGVMRNIRGLKAKDSNDFEIRKSDSILETLKDMTSTLRWATIIIAMLTLLGAAIGLMNIMLVTVTERTKEIGVRKALGATSNNVLIQFLTEAVMICILGGIVGIILGIILGLGVTKLMDGRFFIPWAWTMLGLSVCVVVGVISGLYPALKASRLDPIESLRYE